MGCKVIQVTNIPLQVTKDVLYTMFECIGKIEDIRLYPAIRSVGNHYDSRICFIKYKHSYCAETAPLLDNTPLIDRAIRVTPFTTGDKGKIPNEERALEILGAETIKEPDSVSWIDGVAPTTCYKTSYKLLEGLPVYPDLPAHYSISTVERIRKTLVVANLDNSISGETLVDYFSRAGEVKYARFCQRDDDPGCYALVEFVNQESIISGLKLNNSEIIQGRKIKVYHSVDAINKYTEDSNNHSLNEKSSTFDSLACVTGKENEQLKQSGSSGHAQTKSHRCSSSRQRDRRRSRSQRRHRSQDRRSPSRRRHHSKSYRSTSSGHNRRRSRSRQRRRSTSSEHSKYKERRHSRSNSQNHSSSRSHRSSGYSSKSYH